MATPGKQFLWNIVACSDGKVLLCFGDGGLEVCVTVAPTQAVDFARELLETALGMTGAGDHGQLKMLSSTQTGPDVA